MLYHDHLVCLDTLERIIDDGYILSNPNAKSAALLRPLYKSEKFKINDQYPGLYRYAERLPINRILKGSASPITYKSKALAEYLDLRSLYITFNGYWPEKGAYMTTGTFKETEAYTVCARLPENGDKVLVVASAGNTARAFIKVCSENKIPLVMVVPYKNMNAIWSVKPIDPCIRIVAAGGDSDYLDAITLSGIIASLPGFVNEGGAKNVARRAGMGTTVFSFVEAAETIPDLYFQAIGSGTGAIAAYESNLQLIESKQYDPKKMKLVLSQNAPFQPIADAWKKRSRTVEPMTSEEANKKLEYIAATVLSNRNPPYSVKGGLYDILTDTEGEVDAFTNEEAKEAVELFLKTEGALICPEGGIALASLMSYVRNKKCGKNDVIMLNITGGGFDRIKKDFDIYHLQPSLVIDKKDFNPETVEKQLKTLF
ncbi:MAG: cysteate synthase [Clostridia bacterium]|jgi:cysteate synthase|nr:cysteate synthase [Clostridiaceae bacterium]